MVEAHEGTDPSSQPNSHVGIYLRHVQDVSGPRVESLAGPQLDLNPQPIRDAIHAEALADSRAMDGDSRNNLNTLTCVFHYF
jgi:hypothetical protein